MKFETLNQVRKELKKIGFNFKKVSYSEFSAIKYVYDNKEKDSVVVMTRTEPGFSSVFLKKDCKALKDFLDENQKDLFLLQKKIREESYSPTVGICFNEVMLSNQ